MNDPRRFSSTSSRASATATSVRQATAARCRYSERLRRRLAVAGEQQHRADELVAAGDRRLARDARGNAHRPVADPVGDVAAQLVERTVVRRRRAPRPRAAARRSRRARPPRGPTIAATRSRPSPCSTASTISRCSSRSFATSAVPGDLRAAGAAGRRCEPAAPSTEPLRPTRPWPPGRDAPGGLPRRTRRSARGRPPRPEARTPCRHRRRRCGRA